MSMLREQLGAAVNASDLGTTADHERHVDRIGAMACASIDRSKGVLGIDPRGALGSALIRLRYGDDKRALKQAQFLLAKELRGASDRHGRRLERGEVGDTLIVRFAMAVIDEWAKDKCPACTGRGMVGVSTNGNQRGVRRSLRKPSITVAPMMGQAFKVCAACRGSGDRRVSPVARAVALGLSVGVYEKHWARRFDELLWRLSSLDAYIIRATGLQLEKRRDTVASNQEQAGASIVRQPLRAYNKSKMPAGTDALVRP